MKLLDYYGKTLEALPFVILIFLGNTCSYNFVPINCFLKLLSYSVACVVYVVSKYTNEQVAQ